MFESRFQAGELLAKRLKEKGYQGRGIVVLAIPRGGVSVGRVVADSLGAPLGVIVVRKIPAPKQPELALGAVGPGGEKVIDFNLLKRTGTTSEYLLGKIEDLKREIKEREKKFGLKRGPFGRLEGKTVILTDDGIATGATVEAAIRFLRTKSPTKIVLAVPVASRDSIETFEGLVDEIVALDIPEEFYAVGQFYKDFKQVTDEEVVELLNR